MQQQRPSRPKLTREHTKFGPLWKNHLEIPLQNSTAHPPSCEHYHGHAGRQAQEREDQAKQTPLSHTGSKLAPGAPITTDKTPVTDAAQTHTLSLQRNNLD